MNSPMSDPHGPEVRLELVGQVALLIVERPGACNALARSTMVSLGEVVNELDHRVNAGLVRAVVFMGASGRFVAGGDVIDLLNVKSEVAAHELSRGMQDTLRRLAALSCPVIAAIDAYAIGGGVEVALACDLRVIAADAFLHFKHADLALTTAWGGQRRLAALVGPQRALRLLWDAAKVYAEDALRLDLVDRIAAPGESAEACARAWATSLAQRPPHVLAAMKRLSRRSESEVDPGAIDRLESSIFSAAWMHCDHDAAVQRLLSERRPRGVLPRRGRFVVFEGLDGAGTTTQMHLLATALRSRGQEVLTTGEPSGGPIGRLLREALGSRISERTDGRFPAASIALLFAADRHDHLKNEIEPALDAGITVICDRFDYSSLAYQGQENDPDWVSAINRSLLRPDLVLLVQVTAEVAASRRATRNSVPEIYEVDDFQRRVVLAYADIARHRAGDPIVTIDGERDRVEVGRSCLEAFDARLVSLKPMG